MAGFLVFAYKVFRSNFTYIPLKPDPVKPSTAGRMYRYAYVLVEGPEELQKLEESQPQVGPEQILPEEKTPIYLMP
jgi:hypothetical protein